MTAGKRKALILYASYGDGHIQVTNALAERFEQSARWETVAVDLFAEAYPVLNNVTKYIYIKSYSLFPNLYGWTYYATKTMPVDTRFSRWFHGWGVFRLKQIVEREKPDAVINTFPMLAMPELRRKTGATVPTFTVLTDYTLHRRWLHPLIDRYYVATEHLKREMTASGVDGERILVTGIPLKTGFRTVDRSPELYRKYGLDPEKQTVLIMAGAYGVLQGLKNVCEQMRGLPGVQLAVVCGKNESLYASMKQYAETMPWLRVFGFMREMHELMSLADVGVTKPGGITLTEAVQCELPLVLFRPVPGQERDNAKFFAASGAAKIAWNDGQLAAQIRSLLQNPEERLGVVRALASLKQPRSAERILEDIERLNPVKKEQSE